MNCDLLEMETLPSFRKDDSVSIGGDDKLSVQPRYQDCVNCLLEEEFYESGNRTPVFFGWV